MITFFVGSNGLFDFDLTFAIEAFLFGLLSILVTSLFLSPLSKQIDERFLFLKFVAKKAILFLNLGEEKLLQSIELLVDENHELERGIKLFKEYTNNEFDFTVNFFQKKKIEILKNIKKDFVIQSSYLFSSAKKEIPIITKNFFEKNFKIFKA